jgi:hypothetical protein
MTKDSLKSLLPPDRFKRVSEDELNYVNKLLEDSPSVGKDVMTNYLEEYKQLLVEFPTFTQYVRAVKFVLYNTVMDMSGLASYKLAHPDTVYNARGNLYSDSHFAALASAYKNRRVIKHLTELMSITTHELFKEKRYDVLNYLYETVQDPDQKTLYRIKASEVFLAQTGAPAAGQPAVTINNNVVSTTNTVNMSDMFEDNMTKFKAFVHQSKELLKQELVTVEQIGNFKVQTNDSD